MSQREVVGVDERVGTLKAIPLGLQHFMSMFGSTVLVPLLTGMSPSLAIMCSGIGTILYLLVTHHRIPSYLGSSFAFITPIVMIGASQGLSAAGSGIVAAGLVYVIVAGIIKLAGTGWINRLLPTPVVAPVIIVIGLGLSATAINMAFTGGGEAFNGVGLAAAAITLLAAVFFSTFFSGFIATVPVLLAVIVGYIVAVFLGLVDFQPVLEANWVGLPHIAPPTISMSAIVLIAPVAFVVIIEHIGHLLVVGEIVGKDYSAMLPKSLLGDGLATMTAGFLGGTPATTYAENIGVMSATRVYSTEIFWWAAGFAFVIGAFCPKIEALINSIPTAVMGGVSLLLFGLIASNGLRMLVTDKVDFSDNRNLMLVSVIMVVGIGMETSSTVIPLGDYSLPGMATAALLGVLLNLILPKSKGEASPAPVVKEVVDSRGRPVMGVPVVTSEEVGQEAQDTQAA